MRPARPFARALAPRCRGALAALVIGAGVAASTADACSFDLVKPEKTVIDRLLDADDIVLARPGVENAFSYRVAEILAGDTDGAAIAQLVDTRTRRMLSGSPEDAVLFVRNGTADWRRLAYVGPAFRPVLHSVLNNRAHWRGGYHPDRRELVEGLQASDDPVLGSLVIAELDRMPYALLRQTEIRISSTRLLRDIWTRQGYAFQAVRVLLLGLNGDATAREAVEAAIAQAAERDVVRNLGAFAAALVEMDGVAGVRALSERFLDDPYQPLDKLDPILVALAVHNAVGDAALRTAISGAIGRAVTLRPELGVRVAVQFSAQSDWSQAPALRPLLRDRLLNDRNDLLAVSSYLLNARDGGAFAQRRPKQDG